MSLSSRKAVTVVFFTVGLGLTALKQCGIRISKALCARQRRTLCVVDPRLHLSLLAARNRHACSRGGMEE